MRPGLVLVGVVFLVLSGATLLAFNFTPTTTTSLQTSVMLPSTVQPGDAGWAIFPGTDAGSSTFTIIWNSTIPLQAQLFDIPSCHPATPACAQGAPAAAWPANASGTWSATGSLQFPFLLTWVGQGNVSGSISASTHEWVTSASGPPLLDSLAVNATALTLVVVGALALFLGLFLRGGVLKGPAPLISRSADDAPSIAGQPPPGRGR